MNTEYTTPANSCSDYETMSSIGRVYKSVQMRKSNFPTKRVHYLKRSSSNRTYNVPSIYLAFVFVLSAFNFAATCYLIVSTETRLPQSTKYIHTVNNKDNSIKCDQLDSITGSMNSMMHSVSFTIPHVVTSAKNDIFTKLSVNNAEIKELLKYNQMNLNVKMGGNKSVNFQSGNGAYTTVRGRQSDSSTTSLPSHTTIRPTVVSRVRPGSNPFYPLTSLERSESILKNMDSRFNLNTRSDNADDSRADDYANMSPVM
uniref:Transmembrane protein n=1 Tax=Eothenomys eva jeilongvirus TaxID=3028505 RepID=A0AAT9TSY5_9MONO|nr:MAG: transmembrane protein [Eothenomys eva jeilongvirus]